MAYKSSGAKTYKKQPARRGHVVLFGLSVVSLLTAGGIVTYSTTIAEREAAAPVYPVDELPAHVVLAGALIEAGISPEALAVAGLTTEQAGQVIETALEEARSREVQLRTALENKHNAQRHLTLLRRQSGSSQQDLTAAKELLASATQTYDALISLIKTPAASRLDAAQQRRFAACHANASREMPLEYGAHSWSDEEAASIAQACRQKTACEARGEELDADCAAVLRQADANSDVAVARQTIETRLESIQAVWDQKIRADD